MPTHDNNPPPTDDPPTPTLADLKADQESFLPQYLDIGQVAAILNVCERTVWRMVERKDLPEPTRFSKRIVRWSYDDVRWCIKYAPDEICPEIESIP